MQVDQGKFDAILGHIEANAVRYPFNFETVYERPAKIPLRCRAPFDFLRRHDHGPTGIVMEGESRYVMGVKYRQCRSCGRWQYLNILALKWWDAGFETPVPAVVRNPSTLLDPLMMRAAIPRR